MVRPAKERSMKWSKTIQLVEAHCEGEIGKVLTAGVVDIPGETMLDKMNHINRVDDSLRRFVVFEPRGCVQMSVNLLLAPTRPEAAAGFIVLQADQAHAMSGSNCMCVATTLLETGIVPMREPETRLVLDTPAGLVTARAACGDGKCQRVSLDMVPAFVEALDVTVETEAHGRVTGDVAFGGVYYALVDVEQVGLRIEPRAAHALMTAGTTLRRAFADAVRVRHPERPGIDNIAYLMFRDRDADGAVRTCTTVPPGRVDRSPCGTGTSANLAVMHARNEISVGARMIARSIIGSEFDAELLAETSVGGRPAVLPRIGGRAWI
jgi:proline racemase